MTDRRPTGEHGSLALVHQGRTLEELALHAPTGFAHVLYGALSGLLARNRDDREEKRQALLVVFLIHSPNSRIRRSTCTIR